MTIILLQLALPAAIGIAALIVFALDLLED